PGPRGEQSEQEKEKADVQQSDVVVKRGQSPREGGGRAYARRDADQFGMISRWEPHACILALQRHATARTGHQPRYNLFGSTLARLGRVSRSPAQVALSHEELPDLVRRIDLVRCRAQPRNVDRTRPRVPAA